MPSSAFFASLERTDVRRYNELWGQLKTLHDEFYSGDETMGRKNFRRQMTVNFCFFAMKYAGCRVPKKLEERLTGKEQEMPTPAESRAVRKTSAKRSAASQDFGRAVMDGVPLVKDRIWERISSSAAKAGVSVDEFLNTTEGRALGELYSSRFSTPIDTAAKEPALSEESHRLGVRLN